MNTTSKALTLSLAFHTLMALFAAFILSVFHTAPEKLALPLTKIALVPLSASPSVATPPSSPAPQPSTEMPREKRVSTPRETVQKQIIRDIPPEQAKVLSAPSERPTTTATAPSSSVESKPSPLPAVAADMPVATPKTQPKPDISAEKQSFFAGLRTQIQQRLRYPSAARRRGMEGDIDIRFTLDSGGTIHNITITEGAGIFHEAAKNAVASASGIKIPEALFGIFPTEIKLTLEFRLD